MNKSTNGGFIFPSFLAFVTLVAALAFYRGWHGLKVLRQRSDYAHALHAKSKARDQMLSSAAQTAFSESGLHCSEHNAKHADITIGRRLCTRYDRGDLLQAVLDGSALVSQERFPQFNYNQVLQRPTSCSYTRLQSNLVTPFAFQLSPQSAISRKVCIPMTIASTTSQAYTGNLAASHELSVPEEVQTIAAAGFIDLAGGLIINADTLIVAGGDIHLKKLNTAASSVRVTLLSATGSVVLEEVSSAIELRAIGWQGTYIPANATLVEHEVLPPRLFQEILSLTAASQS